MQWCSLMALTVTGTHYPEGSILMDCPTISFANIEALAQRRAAWKSISLVGRRG